jgi:excisionase family DNA binding protein
MAIQDLSSHPRVYVSVAELAAYWRVSRRYLYKQVETGALDAIRFGPRSFRISVPAALEFEQSHSVPHHTGAVHTEQQSASSRQSRYAVVKAHAAAAPRGGSTGS